MKGWSRSTLRYAVLMGLIAALLPLLAFLQFRWIGQISEAERDRLQTTLRAALARVSQSFNRDLTRAYFLLDANWIPLRLGSEFSDRYNTWVASTNYPKLVKAIYRVDHEGAKLTRYNHETGEFTPTEWPQELEPVRTRMEDALRRGGPPVVRMFGSGIFSDVPALVAPIMDVEREEQREREWQRDRERERERDREGPGRTPPRVLGYSIVQLDLDYIRSAMLPDLLHRELSPVHGQDYQALVTRRSEPNQMIFRSDASLKAASFAQPDASVNMFDIRPEYLGPLSALRRPMQGGDGHRGFGGSGGERFGWWTSGRGGPRESRDEGPSRAGAAGPNLDNGPRTMPDLAAGRWTLRVKHKAGSLEAVVNQARNRNLAVSFAILILLAVSVGVLLMFTQRAQWLARMQMEFVAGVSHELRTPVAVICSAADNLAEGLVSTKPQAQQYGSVIRNEGRRLASIVEQILGFARTETGSGKYQVGPVEIAGVFDHAISGAPELQQSGMKVEQFIAPDVAAPLADSDALAQCIANLLTNAAKYASEGGVVFLRAEPAHGKRNAEVRISVQDRGEGLDRADLPHLFQPFYRGARAVAGQIHGVGLGLSIVKRVIEAQGGRIHAENAPEGGARFVIHLKASSQSAASANLNQHATSHPAR